MVYKDNAPPRRPPQVLTGCSQKVKEVMGYDITFTNKDMVEVYDITVGKPGQVMEVDHYAYMDKLEELQEPDFLPQDEALMAEYDYLIEQWDEVGSLAFDGCTTNKDNVHAEYPQRVNEVTDESYGILERAMNESLLLRKGIYPYVYMDGFGKLQETELPPREAFYSTHTGEEVSQADYEREQQVWKEMDINNMKGRAAIERHVRKL